MAQEPHREERARAAAAALSAGAGRVLLWGKMGVGRPTLAAARFRLPLVHAVRRLARGLGRGAGAALGRACSAAHNALGGTPAGVRGGTLSTGRAGPLRYTAPASRADAWCGRQATLLGGVFGDPLLHVRLRHRKRSLLFDLGDAGRLPKLLAHQVADLFLSPAHLDHVGGFPWFLRPRLGPFFACRVFGPPGVIECIGHFLAAITWDRIGDNGAASEVAEVHDNRLVRARLQPGKKRRNLPDWPVVGGVILEEPEFTVRAAVVDHGIPAVAYALATRRELNVRKDRLAARDLPPGPWLAAMKQALWQGLPKTPILLPDGSEQETQVLAEELVLVRPGKTLAYAADAADTPDNRARLVDPVRGAHTLFCEAGFTTADRARADATQHLTARAAVELARAAGAERLAPFHFSRRYERDPSPLWAELRAAVGPVTLLGDPPEDAA